MKYQFCIRFKNIDANSAASKAVLDCNKIFSANGYQDYTFTVGDNANKARYYLSLLKQLLKFFFSVKPESIIGIQYPLLSINHVFKYFIKFSRFKKVKFFCIIHDLESLRTGGKDDTLIDKEVANLNFYDIIIVHNEDMKAWLSSKGIRRPMISLNLFDYLTNDFDSKKLHNAKGPVVYAGNLIKSTFIYSLNQIGNQLFTVFGPGFQAGKALAANITFGGQFSPDQIPKELRGSFGLIWDGSSIDQCDEVLGNYLRYNNPHKCSLYIAAGLPLIAPASSAIAKLITQLNIGLLITCLHDLAAVDINAQSYEQMQMNVLTLREKVISGWFFSTALNEIETLYAPEKR